MLEDGALVKGTVLDTDNVQQIVLHDWDARFHLYLCEVAKKTSRQPEQDKRWIVLQYDAGEGKYHSAMPSSMKQKRHLTDLTVEGVVHTARVRMMRKMEAVSFFKEMRRQSFFS